MRPAELTVQILVTGPRQHRARWIQRAQQGGGFLVDVAIELLRMTLSEPSERVAPGWVGVDGIRDDRWMVVPQVHQFLGLGQDSLTKERQRASVRPVHIGADQWQILP